MNDDIPQQPVPLWVKVLIVLTALPVLDLPWLWAGDPVTDTGKVLLWLYPAYVVVSAVCEWLAYRRRPEVTWILMLLLVLAHAAMWVLCYPPQ